MAVSTLLASLLMAQAPAPATTVEVAFDELKAGNAVAAIDKIERSSPRAEHPAQMINLGVAFARLGRTDDARAMFEAAANSEDRYRLETSTGDWIDSRDLALRALAMLDKGAFSGSQLAAR